VTVADKEDGSKATTKRLPLLEARQQRQRGGLKN
jgi:hypothetical protein